MKVFRYIVFVFLIMMLAQATRMRLLFVLAYALIGVLVLSFIWAKLSLRWLQITRQGTSNRCQVGDNYEEVLTLRNTSILPKLWLEIVDNSDLPGHRLNCVQSLRPLGTVKWRAKTMCVLRGRFRLGAITVTAGDPFGLFRFKKVFREVRHLLVLPAAFEINKFEALSGALPGGNTVSKPTHHTTPDINGLRDYRPGDSLNRIHWPSSARHGKLVVKEFEFDPTVNIQIFLDMDIATHWLVNHNSRGGTSAVLPASSGVRSVDSTEEYAVTAAATLTRHYIMEGRSVGMISWGQDHEIVPPDRGERQFMKILESLAIIRAVGKTDFGQLIAAETTRLRSTDTLILITATVEENWLSILPHLLRRGIKMAVVLIEPRTFGAPVDNSLLAVGSLAAMNVPVYLIKRGDEISQALDSEMARLTARMK